MELSIGKFGRLLEDLALVEFSALCIFALPLPVLSNLSLALVRLGIQLLPAKIKKIKTNYNKKVNLLIAGIVDLPVLAQLKGQLLPLEDPDSTDGGIVVLAEQTTGCKSIFLEFLQALEHSTNEIA